MIKKNVLIERKDGKIQKYKVSSISLKKNYFTTKAEGYKGIVHIRKEVSFAPSKSIRLLTGDKRVVQEGRLNKSVDKFNLDRALRQVSHVADKTRYKFGYIKAKIVITTTDGEKIPVAVVTSPMRSKITKDKMLNEFKEAYRERLDKMEQSPGLENRIKSVRVISFGFYTKPNGDGK